MVDPKESALPVPAEKALNTDSEAIGLTQVDDSTNLFERQEPLKPIVETTQTFQLTKIISSKPERLSKRYHLENGKLTKESAGQLVRGKYKVLSLATLNELAALVMALNANEALAYGVPQRPQTEGSIASRSLAGPGELTRTRDSFDWPAGPGCLFLDYDPPPDAAPITAAELWTKITAVGPELASAPVVITASASGFINNLDTGEELRGPGGWHGYVLVADGRDIPRIGKAIYGRTWLAGHGRFDISRAGTLLERSLIDANVWQPERLDFAAGADCVSPLEQRRPIPLLFNIDSPPFDSTIIKNISDQDSLDRLNALKTEARAAIAERATIVREKWIEESAEAAMKGSTETDPVKKIEERDRHRVTYRAATEDGVLMGDFVLTFEDNTSATVGQVLDDPEKYHGKRCCDPLEPSYRNDSRIAWVCTLNGGRPFIYSHCHGGFRYKLFRPPATLQVSAGDMPRVLKVVEDRLAKVGEIFQRGGELVRLVESGLLLVSPPWLRTHCEKHIAFQKYNKKVKSWVADDCPNDLPPRLLANRGAWPFHELIGIERAPTLRPDGSLLTKPGYDIDTGLLLLDYGAEGWPAIPSEPTIDDARRAFATLWEPFALFPFLTDLDKAVVVAAMLTAVIRRVLPTAPAFPINAYHAGTGKTKLARSLGLLVNGRVPSVAPWSEKPEEQRKALMAALLAGPGSLVLDNIERTLSSAELCACLTAPVYEDRRLGVSERVKAPTRVLLMMTGNNLIIKGDLSRRCLPITLDHEVERPETLSFPFDPVARVAERWLQLRAAALTILRAFVVVGKPAAGPGCMGSFEEWDRLVRQCVIWMDANRITPFSLADPADAVIKNIEADPDTQKLKSLLYNWFKIFKDQPIKVADLINKAHDSTKDMELAETLNEIAGIGSSICPRRLGRWIEKHAGRQLGGKKIGALGRTGGAVRWGIIEVSSK